MALYNGVIVFGGVAFKAGDIIVSSKIGSLKTNIGRMYVEKQIPLRNVNDTVIQMEGVITGLSQTAGQSISDAIEVDRTALIALDDGYFHSYSDGRHSGNFVIVPGSLVFNDDADRVQGQPYKFTVSFLSWGGS